MPVSRVTIRKLFGKLKAVQKQRSLRRCSLRYTGRGRLAGFDLLK